MTGEGKRSDESATGFIAVVKILKVSEKSALTHAVMKKETLGSRLVGSNSQEQRERMSISLSSCAR